MMLQTGILSFENLATIRDLTGETFFWTNTGRTMLQSHMSMHGTPSMCTMEGLRTAWVHAVKNSSRHRVKRCALYCRRGFFWPRVRAVEIIALELYWCSECFHAIRHEVDRVTCATGIAVARDGIRLVPCRTCPEGA